MLARTPLSQPLARGLAAGLLAALLAAGCTCPRAESTTPTPTPTPTPAPTPTPTAGDRTPAVDPADRVYARVEGIDHANGCAADTDCKIGGCSAEICSAEEGLNSTCEAYDWPSKGASCGCVSGQCIWYREAGGPAPTPTPEPTPAPGPLAGQGAPCGADGTCAAGLTCVSYYGIAGPSGPKFTSCEIPCMANPKACPAGQSCITIADGPGQVCRPAPHEDQPQ